jgi:hypothetical protein
MSLNPSAEPSAKDPTNQAVVLETLRDIVQPGISVGSLASQPLNRGH